jgi:hypothetical protein
MAKVLDKWILILEINLLINLLSEAGIKTKKYKNLTRAF